MGKKLDLKGKRFGRLVVVKYAGQNKHKKSLWLCKCDCGNEKIISAHCLRNSDTKSCGCYNKERVSGCLRLDLVGERFGRLKVIELAYMKDNKSYWQCECDCGNESVVMGSKLKFGHTKSCGCYRVDAMRESCMVDMIGKKFGRLYVICECGYSLEKHKKRVKWLCRCKCGNMVAVIGKSLRNGNTLSCGCYRKDRFRERNSAENNWNWRGGVTSMNQKIRDIIKKNRWVVEIFHRDNYTCQRCGVRGANLHAHHIILFSEIINFYNITAIKEASNCPLLFDVGNGITLCKKCHKWTHGFKNINKELIRSMEDHYVGA